MTDAALIRKAKLRAMQMTHLHDHADGELIDALADALAAEQRADALADEVERQVLRGDAAEQERDRLRADAEDRDRAYGILRQELRTWEQRYMAILEQIASTRTEVPSILMCKECPHLAALDALARPTATGGGS